MAKPWAAEQIVTNDVALELISKQFPELVPLTIKLIGEGFDNTVYQVNQQYVFRFPRRSIAVDLLLVECALLPHLFSLGLPLMVSEPVFFGKPEERYSWPFVGYRFIEGESPGAATVDQRMQSARPLAQFLSILHRFPVEKAKELGVQNDLLGRLDLAKRLSQVDSNMNKAMELGLSRDRRVLDSFLSSLRDGGGDNSGTGSPPKCLVHGDLHIRNVLVDENHIISGVIDWGDVHTGDPAVDLSFVYSYLPPEGRSLFFSIYGETEESTLKLARFRSIHISLLLLLYGYDQQDDVLVAATQDSLKLAFEDL
ncbi:phosphotransferase [Paenibacillus radicis (ex Xue et al. 2023)]|uniref:Phosphotransferase n=1 Tax=Paenibacillus radicis (ex Xue et al. 2023) TaxID=2972489 RepID=A0ABT1YNK9_9BACL|nr:phosphotransferase [Paenibacillus radicis (ex Xue et al. 2023)]MCR8634756.1 phosphotransferase [Paenibacillus radicis (ex Xue et al. 2023)]